MKLTKYHFIMQKLIDELNDKIGLIEEKRDSIEDKALDRDRDMTDAEQERYDYLDSEINCIYSCIDALENAQYEIEDYL